MAGALGVVLDRAKSDKHIGDHSGPLYFLLLDQLFTNGAQRFGEDTKKRQEFIDRNQHLLSCSVLCLLFAYLESTLGGKSANETTWIERHGGRAKEELYCLRIVRNAFVHTNSVVTDLKSATKEDINRLKCFIHRLESGEIIDDLGNVYPTYMSLHDDGKIELKREAILTFTSIGRALSH